MTTPAAPFENLRGHIELLAELLAGKPETVREHLEGDAAAGAAFLDFVERQHLAWYLTAMVDGAGLRDVLPPERMARLEHATRARRATQEALLTELVRLAPRFVEHEIDVILLKGAHLAQRFFGGPLQRGFLDLDLLIHPRRLRAAEALLAELGYVRLSTVLLSRRLTTRFTHGLDFAKGDLRLDLHWSLGAHASYRIDTARLWRRRLPFRLAETELRVLADEDALAFHLLSLFEDLNRGAARMRSFVDVHAMVGALDARSDWRLFWEQRAVERTARPCRAVLALTFALLDCEARAPRLAGSVASLTAAARAGSPRESIGLIAAERGATFNKRWAMRQYECSAAVSLAWWAVSLPHRLAVYDSGRIARLRRRWRA